MTFLQNQSLKLVKYNMLIDLPNRCDFHTSCGMGVTAVLLFEEWWQTHFYSLGTIFEENMWGVKRGVAPWLWVPNRGEKHPCWHTTFLGKSSVLYLLLSLVLDRGCLMSGRNFPETAEQTDFACENIWKRELAIAKSGCSYVGDADILVVSEKLICTTGEQKGYI